MSTKIYNGIIARNITLDTLYSQYLHNGFIENVRSEILVLHRKCISRMTTRFMDCGETPLPTKEAYMLARGYFEKQLFEAEMHRRVAADFSFCFAIKPMNGHVFGTTFIENKELESLFFREIPVFSNYGFCNNTEKPKSVSDSEWLQREQDWARLLPNHLSWVESGFLMVDLNPKNAISKLALYSGPDEILDLSIIGDMESRERAFVRSRVDDYVAAKAGNEKLRPSDSMRLFQSLYSDPEYAGLLNSYKDEFAARTSF